MSLSSLWPRPQVILIPMPRPRDFCLVSGQNLGFSHLASYLLDRQACVNYWNKCQKKQKQLGIGLKKIGIDYWLITGLSQKKVLNRGLWLPPFILLSIFQYLLFPEPFWSPFPAFDPSSKHPVVSYAHSPSHPQVFHRSLLFPMRPVLATTNMFLISYSICG